MKAYDLTELALRNLRESVLRNSLTTVGISVGVASLVAMLSLGIGLQQLASRRLQKSGLFDTVVVMSRRDLRSFNREQQNTGPAPADSPVLDEGARQQIERLPNVREAYPDIRFITELRYEGKPHLTMVAGLAFSAKNNDAFDGMQGKFFSSENAPEIILQKAFAEELLGKRPKPGADGMNVGELARPLLGQELVMRYTERVENPGGRSVPPKAGESRLAFSDQIEDVPQASYSVFFREQKLKIVGVSDLDPDSMRGAARARVFLPLALAENLHVMQPSNLRDTSHGLGGSPTYATVSVRVTSPKYVQEVEDAIRKMGFNTFSITDATRSLRQFFAVLDLFLGIFGSLALAVASIGIVNTLVMAILERRREIGIMKALGASDTDVKKLFFAEAGAMGVMGGAVGVALGWMIGRVINIGTNVYLRRQNLPPEQIWAVPWWLVAGAIVFAILVSLVSGMYPAGRAARLDPVQALRYE
ncbi:MAG TPA: FtsX-like permease family protein [Terriglobales bacterium]|nr:FtsX-like permease family protein [Terriglobales bacterium]